MAHLPPLSLPRTTSAPRDLLVPFPLPCVSVATAHGTPSATGILPAGLSHQPRLLRSLHVRPAPDLTLILQNVTAGFSWVICSFICSFNKYLLNAYETPGIQQETDTSLLSRDLHSRRTERHQETMTTASKAMVWGPARPSTPALLQRLSPSIDCSVFSTCQESSSL